MKVPSNSAGTGALGDEARQPDALQGDVQQRAARFAAAWKRECERGLPLLPDAAGGL